MLIDTVNPLCPAPRRAATPDPRLLDYIERATRTAAQARADGVAFSAAGARDSLAGLTLAHAAPGPELARVVDGEIAGGPAIPVRLYDPEPGQALPTCVYLHGGGHMAGSVAVYDPVCRRLAVLARCRVIAVEYRLAPEHPYPAALDDGARALAAIPAWLAAQDARAHGPGLFLAGDSGGGALTATLTVTQPQAGLAGQMLFYPSLDYTLDHPSVAENGDGYLLDADRVRWYFDNYFQNGEDRIKASPLHMPARALPPTLLVTAGFCPLRDEGYAYAQRLRAAGVACEHFHSLAMVHAFLNLHNLVPDICAAVYEAAGRFMRFITKSG